VEPGEWAERGRKWTRFRAWLEDIEKRGVSVNIGSFVGGGTLREYACGWDLRAPTSAEVETMCRVMDECMREGAFGIATALIYPPGSFAGTEELTAIARVIGKYGGVYITHVRSEDEKLVEGIEEAIAIGRAGKCAIEIYHLKALGKAHWHRMSGAITAIERARAEGLDITAGMYPYTGCGTNITVLVPNWAAEGGKLYENVRTQRARIRAEMAVPNAWNADPDCILPSGLLRPENQKYVGQTLGQIARSRGQEWPDTVIDLLLSEQQGIFTMYLLMSEENVRTQLKLPWLCVSTDAGACDPELKRNPVHPRAYGTYTRVLGKYARDEKLLTLEDAVRKMTFAVAARLSLRERGLLSVGNFADVVVFDPATVADRATFTDTHRLSVGVRDVWVNGKRVLKGGTHTGAMAGRIVDGPGRVS
jgi:N-acyl-D-aspartate/D-glutamate deacylase